MFQPDSLNKITEKSTAGGGYSIVRFVPKEDCEIIPLPDADNPHLTSGDFVLKAGKQWIDIFCDNAKTGSKEEQGDNKFADAYTSTLEFYVPGDNDYIRQAINEGVFKKEGYC